MVKKGLALMGLAVTFCGIFSVMMGVFYTFFMALIFTLKFLFGN